MAFIPVESYWLRYSTKDKSAQVGLKYSGGTPKHSLTLPAQDAIFLADLLRYEKPVYFDPDTGVIATTEGEPVGEQEK
jgi:hypothetical protein